MTVAQWPSYLLRGVPASTRALLSARADEDNVSLADVIRQALCHHYQMDCDPASFRYQPTLDTGGDVILIRIQPEVWRRMKKETRGKYGRTKQLILDCVDTYLGEP